MIALGAFRIYPALAAVSFRRYSTYVAATWAGVFTNSVFGIIYSFVYLAIWQQRPDAGGYDATDAVTYVWLGQALLMTVALWGGGTTDELPERIRSGQIGVDLYRPIGLLGWYLATDLGRAAFHFLVRGVVPTLVGVALFHIRMPGSLGAWAGFIASMPLAVTVSFAVRFLVASTAFWILDQSGVRLMSGVLAVFFSGLVLPLVIFHEPWRTLALNLPWAAYIQTPADIWLGKRAGAEIFLALGQQALWALALLGSCAWVLHRATRKVVVQGG